MKLLRFLEFTLKGLWMIVAHALFILYTKKERNINTGEVIRKRTFVVKWNPLTFVAFLFLMCIVIVVEFFSIVYKNTITLFREIYLD